MVYDCERRQGSCSSRTPNLTEDGLKVSIEQAQRLDNNRRWPNAVVLRLENVEFKKRLNRRNVLLPFSPVYSHDSHDILTKVINIKSFGC